MTISPAGLFPFLIFFVFSLHFAQSRSGSFRSKIIDFFPKKPLNVFFNYFNYFPILRPYSSLTISRLSDLKRTFYKLKRTFYKLKRTFYKLKRTFYKLIIPFNNLQFVYKVRFITFTKTHSYGNTLSRTSRSGRHQGLQAAQRHHLRAL